MKFVRVEMFFLVWLLPVLALAYMYGGRRRRAILNAFASVRAMTSLAPSGLVGRRRLRAALVLAAALLLVTALAGPQYGFQWQQIERRGVDIIIALDCSRSMLAGDIQPTRLDRAKREIFDLLGMLQGDRIGLVAFSGTAFLQCPLTLDYQAFNLFLDVLTPDYLPVGGTDLAAAVETAAAGFDAAGRAEKAIILITDGEQTGSGDALAAAEASGKAGIKLFCIGVGSEQGVPIPESGGGFTKDTGGRIVLSRLDEPLLTRMALVTGGSYVRSVAGDMDLDAIYHQQIRATMETATLESGRKQVWADRFQWPLALAVALLIAALGIPSVKAAVKVLPVLAILAMVLSPLPASAGPAGDGYKSYQKGDYENALKNFIDGQLADPDNPELMYNIGNAYYQTGDFEAARDNYKQALKAAGPALKQKLHYNLGNTAYRRGDLKEAVNQYEAALNLAPDDLQAKENLAFVKERQQQKQEQQQQQANGDDARQQDQSQSSNGDAQSGEKQEEQKQSRSQQQDRGEQNQAQQGQGPQHQNQEQNREQGGEQSAPHYGSEMNADQDHSQGQSTAEENQPRPAQGQALPGESMPPAAADRMLNRLRDQPGRAMMPGYRKRQVEKDW
jgi:Ca-activated chloride channel family protein